MDNKQEKKLLIERFESQEEQNITPDNKQKKKTIEYLDIPIDTKIKNFNPQRTMFSSTAPFVSDYFSQKGVVSATTDETTPKKKGFIPADISSFIDVVETVTNRTVLKLSNAGYKITPKDREKIFQRALQIAAQRGMLPAKKEVDDRSLLLLLYRKGEISISPDFDLSSPDFLEKLSPTDRQLFLNKKDYYTNMVPVVERIIYGSQTQNLYSPLLTTFLSQFSGGSQVIDLSK